MNPQAAQAPSALPDQGSYGGDEHAGGAAVPLCFVIDSDKSIRHFLSLILHGAGIDTQEFADAAAFRAAVARRAPDLVFLNIALESAEAIECVVTLGTKAFGGFVQLMSNRGSAVLEHVRSIGTQHGLQMLPPLKKPFDTGGVLKILHDLKLGHPPVLAARVDLDTALRKGWMEFWYQPKIDLRKKQLVGVEAFARARDPQNGVLLPSAFMPGAGESALIALSEMAVTQGLRACAGFAALGVNLRLARQYSGQCAGQAAARRHRRHASGRVREMARADRRHQRRPDPHRSRTRGRACRKASAARHSTRDRRFRPRPFRADAACAYAVRGDQARPRFRQRLRHQPDQRAGMQDRDRPRPPFRQRGGRYGDRKGLRRAGA